MRFITEEGYQELVAKALTMYEKGGEKQQAIGQGITLVLSKLQCPDDECGCNWRDEDDDAEGLPPNQKN